MGSIILLILQMKELKKKEVKTLTKVIQLLIHKGKQRMSIFFPKISRQ